MAATIFSIYYGGAIVCIGVLALMQLAKDFEEELKTSVQEKEAQ